MPIRSQQQKESKQVSKVISPSGRVYKRRITIPMITTSFRLPEDQLEMLRDHAGETEVSVNTIVMKEIRKLLKRLGKI